MEKTLDEQIAELQKKKEELAEQKIKDIKFPYFVFMDGWSWKFESDDLAIRVQADKVDSVWISKVNYRHSDFINFASGKYKDAKEIDELEFLRVLTLAKSLI